VTVPSLTDAVLLSGLYIATPHIVPNSWLAASNSWLRSFVTFAAVGYQYSISWPRHWIGQNGIYCRICGHPGGGAGNGRPDDLITGFWGFASIMLARILWTLVIRAGRSADKIFRTATKAERDRAIAAGIRSYELTVINALHGTAASTLLMVGLGLTGDRDELRSWVRRDLETLNSVRSGQLVKMPADVARDSGDSLRPGRWRSSSADPTV
jgi:hypothetical protein